MSRDRILADLEALYRETGNPLYVWRAFAEECPRGEPLPGWIEDYLRGCAAAHAPDQQPGLLDLADKLPPSTATRMIGSVMGLSRRGWNAFADYRADQRNARLAFHYERLVKPGQSEAVVEIASKRFGVKRAAVHRRIAKARKHWKAQK